MPPHSVRKRGTRRTKKSSPWQNKPLLVILGGLAVAELLFMVQASGFSLRQLSSQVTGKEQCPAGFGDDNVAVTNIAGGGPNFKQDQAKQDAENKAVQAAVKKCEGIKNVAAAEAVQIQIKCPDDTAKDPEVTCVIDESATPACRALKKVGSSAGNPSAIWGRINGKRTIVGYTSKGRATVTCGCTSACMPTKSPPPEIALVWEDPEPPNECPLTMDIVGKAARRTRSIPNVPKSIYPTVEKAVESCEKWSKEQLPEATIACDIAPDQRAAWQRRGLPCPAECPVEEYEVFSSEVAEKTATCSCEIVSNTHWGCSADFPYQCDARISCAKDATPPTSSSPPPPANPRSADPAQPASITGAYLFYAGSTFGQTPAPDKQALLAGQTASFTNISGYSGGITGVAIDITRLPQTDTALSNADIDLKVGTTSDTSAWAPAPTPAEASLTPDTNGTHRLYLTFPPNSIKNTYLAVTLKATPATGLTKPYQFIYGSAPGDTGASFTPNTIAADAADLQAIGQHLTPQGQPGTESVTNPYDLNKDKTVDAFDLQVVSQNLKPKILELITPQ